MAILGLTFENGNVNSISDSRLYNQIGATTGIYKDVQNECSATSSGLTATVNTGYINIQGRQIRVDSLTDVVVDALASGFGYIIAKVDLSQATGSQVELTFKQQLVSLPTLTQEDINGSGNVYEFPIYSYTQDGFNLTLTDVREYWGQSGDLGFGKVVASGTGFSGSANDVIVDMQSLGGGHYKFITYNFSTSTTVQIKFSSASTGRRIAADFAPSAITTLNLSSDTNTTSANGFGYLDIFANANYMWGNVLTLLSTTDSSSSIMNMIRSSLNQKDIRLNSDYLTGTFDWILVKLHD